jgi:hypothetical protein
MRVAIILVRAIRLGTYVSTPAGIAVTDAFTAGTVFSAVYAVARIGFGSIAVGACPAGIARARQTAGAVTVVTSIPAAVIYGRIRVPVVAVITIRTEVTIKKAVTHVGYAVAVIITIIGGIAITSAGVCKRRKTDE